MAKKSNGDGHEDDLRKVVNNFRTSVFVEFDYIHSQLNTINANISRIGAKVREIDNDTEGLGIAIAVLNTAVNTIVTLLERGGHDV